VIHAPKLEEQTEIVRRVDQIFAHADRKGTDLASSNYKRPGKVRYTEYR